MRSRGMHNIFNRFGTGWFDDKRSGSLVNRFRRRRFRLFRALLDTLPPPVRILDVGGTEWFWRMMACLPGDDIRITLLNRMPRNAHDKGFECVVGDGCAMTMFADRQFDLVLSNAVLEHVTPWSRCRRMANEIRRVGNGYYVQTPNRGFPIEAHTRLPGFQFWPRRAQVAWLRRFNLGVFPRQPERIAAQDYLSRVHLLSGRDMRCLFPDAVLHRERMLGWTKSWIAVRRPIS